MPYSYVVYQVPGIRVDRLKSRRSVCAFLYVHTAAMLLLDVVLYKAGKPRSQTGMLRLYWAVRVDLNEDIRDYFHT